MPVYGDGSQIRDWLFVEDHARALCLVVKSKRVGETFNIGGHNEKRNLDVVRTICELLDELAPQHRADNITQYADLITFVKDRPGHDARYAIDAGRIQRELGWAPEENFVSGMRKTVLWYLNNESWWQSVLSGKYKLGRLGEGE